MIKLTLMDLPDTPPATTSTPCSYVVRCLLLFCMVVLFPLFAWSATDKEVPADTLPGAARGEKPAYLQNPSAWINHGYTILNRIYLIQSGQKRDTMPLHKKMVDLFLELKSLRKGFYGKEASLSLRSIHTLKMRIAGIQNEIVREQKIIHEENEQLVENLYSILEIGKEIEAFRSNEDSLVLRHFGTGVTQLERRQKSGAAFMEEELNTSTRLENRINELKISCHLFFTDVSAQLQIREASLLEQELPPLWSSPPSIYPLSFLEVIVASFHQTLETIAYYSELSLWRIVIFRFLIFLFCLIPIKIFNDQQRKNKILSTVTLTFLDRFPKSASLVMAMALSPFIFVNPPHTFLEFILIGLTFTVLLLILKNYPLIQKRLFIPIIGYFLVLYMINFFVTPTFWGRLIYTASIFMLIPMFMIFRRVPGYQLRHPVTVRFLILFLMVHLAAGWGLVVWGNYTLGRSVILAGYSLLVIAMILRIALFTLLDYFAILAYYANRTLGVVKVDTEAFFNRVRPLLITGAVLFLVVSYLYNLNLLELVASGISDFLTTRRSLGEAVFTWLSVILFMTSLLLSFLLASLLRHTFQPQHEATVAKRSSFGSLLLLVRLAIIIAGFSAGILLSGLPLTHFSLFLGAMGVGIGFGLQNIISNLISGLIISFERPFVVGDTLDFGHETGKVKEISLRATMVSTSDGADILIPNNTLLSQNLKNWTISNKQRYIEVKLTTTHEAKPETVHAVIEKCLDGLGTIVGAKSIVLLSEINETGLNYTVKLLITDLGLAGKTRSMFLTAIRSAFDEHGIAFAQRSAN